MEKKICIHGHFYQPPRENPWTGVVGRDRSVAPWHDWNERITDECYLPNTAARILDRQGLIRVVSNNYSRISYDFGPTLLAWLERERPGVYEDVLRADALSQDRFSGHGSALAHPYHHVILPLLSRADKETEIRWGIRDFEDRFGRFPEGVWLPEMAVDMETLSVLADHGILFTVLSPHQGRSVTQSAKENPAGDTGIDPAIPYRCPLPGETSIAVFFHDAALSSRVAFGDLLENGDRFADALLSASPRGGLVSIATDGETYGHHRSFGDMALGWCLERIESSVPGTLTVYGEHLAERPPEQEVEIVERTSWSCPHGIDRWWRGCTCESGRQAGWDHGWRGPFYTAIDDLSLRLAEIFSREAGAFFRDPGEARDGCQDLFSNSSADSIEKFFHNHARRPLLAEEQGKALALLEMARQSLAMKTSCAWFFDDIADGEAVQVLCSAARAIQIASEQTGIHLERAFVESLSAITGNRPQYPDGGAVYRDCVLSRLLTPGDQAACLALMEISGGSAHVLHADDYSGELLSSGEIRPTHDLSLLVKPIGYCFMSPGADSAILGLVSGGIPAGERAGEVQGLLLKKGYFAAAERLAALFSPVIGIDEFPPAARHMFVRSHLSRVTRAFERAAGVLFEKYTALEQDHRLYPPWIVRLERYMLSSRLEEAFLSPDSSIEDVRNLTKAVFDLGMTGVLQGVQPSMNRFITRLMEDWVSDPGDGDRLNTVIEGLVLARNAGAPYPEWLLQNQFIPVRDGPARAWEAGARTGDEEAVAWWEAFQSLGRILGVSVPGGAGYPPQ